MTIIDVRKLDPAACTVLDVRWRLGAPSCRPEHRAGHVPGAVFLDLDEDLCGPPGAGGRHPLPDPTRLQAALRRAGVRAARPVVVYDDGPGHAAARAWWTLTWAGHRDVSVLDGGYQAWTAAGLPVESGEPEVEPGDFTVRPGGLPVLGAAEAAALARDGVLLDARTAVRYAGHDEPVDPVAGHIPGAVNLPADRLVTADGRLRPAGELREVFTAAGAGASAGAYCGSGVTAAHTVWAMHVAGYERAALYVGSWSHWITDPSRPVAAETPEG
ncbi:sulfurtransferase [Actinomadura craniellae]|uniref:Sulfurtransferase n=1 Tax=Actinomadura craniellae TaxID=2231787 RepID=A0A365H7Q5_9ACTN|nr:sulfurtransferase [Actinomadura craniellae]RAY15058.1 sulfurtransferase [Actinomadura craniellae]